METISKAKTIEMENLSKELERLRKYCKALRCRIFVRTKTIVDAEMVYEAKRTEFWKKVVETWPETKLYSGTERADGTILFEKA